MSFSRWKTRASANGVDDAQFIIAYRKLKNFFVSVMKLISVYTSTLMNISSKYTYSPFLSLFLLLPLSQSHSLSLSVFVMLCSPNQKRYCPFLCYKHSFLKQTAAVSIVTSTVVWCWVCSHLLESCNVGTLLFVPSLMLWIKTLFPIA